MYLFYTLHIKNVRRTFLNSCVSINLVRQPLCQRADISLCVLSRPDMCTHNIIIPPCMTGLAPLRSGCFCICPPHLVFYPEFFSFWNAARCVHGRGYPICISSLRDVNSSAATANAQQDSCKQKMPVTGQFSCSDSCLTSDLTSR